MHYALVIRKNYGEAITSIYLNKICDVAVRLVVFVFLPLKGKQKKVNKLCVLCVSAVKDRSLNIVRFQAILFSGGG